MSFSAAKWTPAQLAEVFRQYGPQVGPLPPSVNGSQLLWAMSGVETTFGKNTTPRHEPAFDVGGKYGANAPMPALLKLYGSPLAASSFGPLQIMLCNAGGMSPCDFNDLDSAVHASASFLNSRLRHYEPRSLAEIGEVWNAGSIRPDPDYVEKLTTMYAVPMPAAPTNGHAGA